MTRYMLIEENCIKIFLTKGVIIELSKDNYKRYIINLIKDLMFKKEINQCSKNDIEDLGRLQWSFMDCANIAYKEYKLNKNY